MALGLLWAVLAAVVTNMLVGVGWYGWLFADPFVEAMGMEEMSEEEKAQMEEDAQPGYVVSMASAALATVLLWFLYGWASGMPVSGWVKGVELGFVAWLGFYLGPTLTTSLFEDRPLEVWAIGAGYWGVMAVAYGAYVGLLH